MDSIIPIGQKNTLAEYMILSGADNRPPMLDKDLHDSWKSIMELYMQNRENERMILESVEHDPLIWPTNEENGVIKTKKYDELSAIEKIQADCDLKATNIILQALPSYIYSLVNHHRISKDLWEKVQLLMQVNTKFLNSLPPEWSKFVTNVKLVKDLHTTNFDQLHAYLEQHELHANEVRLMRETHGPKPRGKGDATVVQEKFKLVKAQGNGKVLNEEELEFLADPSIEEGPVTYLKKLKYHLGQFDNVVQKRITPNALAEGEWAAVQQYHIDKQCFEIQKKQFLIEYDRLLDQIISQDIVNIVVNSSVDVNTFVKGNYSAVMNDSVNYVEMCNKCLELKAELIKQHNMVEKDEYNRLSKRFYELEQHCISLEIAMQLNKENFQMNNTSVNQAEPSFNQLFELNNLKDGLQAKDTTIEKLKTNIKRLNKTSTTNNVKKDIDEIETINIELEHRVTKLVADNEHLKLTYKQLYDSIKPSHVRAKEQTESLVNQLNQKSIEITDLNAQLQEKVFVITALKNDLIKFKGKDIVDNATQASNATTISQGMGIVEQAYSLNPLDSASYSAYTYVKIIQELLGYVRDTCPDIHKPRVNPSTSASGSKPSGNTKNDRISQTPSNNEKNKVEVQSRKVKSSLNKRNSDSKNVCNKHVKHPVKGAKALCLLYNKCLFDVNHDMCLIDHVNSMNVRAKSASKKNKKRKEWKPNSKVLTATNKVPLRVPIPLKVVAPKQVVTRVYTRRPKVPKSVQNIKPKVVQIILWYLDSGCSKHMTEDRSQLTNFIHKFLGIVKFSNDQVAKIMGYGEIGNVVISRVYYVEGLGRNLFSVGQFCDSDLEVAFRKHT
ncbi:hypothetical protein Tco_0623885 [Tanacetum coccineum]|uniref:Retrovirus-related Pol polyprotein from transposon TNT 1-94-like beta-barrel domain-containing protein n=1 Tax=Tanacetum coccineum TaxID=301880 RepID=A0ABQ4WCA6_9ASTR